MFLSLLSSLKLVHLKFDLSALDLGALDLSALDLNFFHLKLEVDLIGNLEIFLI
jgi:hypothetical protein